MKLGGRQLDRLGTGSRCGLGWNMRLDLDRGRTQPRGPGRSTGGPDRPNEDRSPSCRHRHGRWPGAQAGP